MSTDTLAAKGVPSRTPVVRNVFLSHPDAVWMTGEGLYDLRSTDELLSEWEENVLDLPVVRVGDSYYLANDRKLSEAVPLFILVDSWRSDTSLLHALVDLNYGQWLDRNAHRWTSQQLMERMTTSELARPVQDGSVAVKGDGRLVLRDTTGASLYVHIDAGDSDEFCAQLLETMDDHEMASRPHQDRRVWPDTTSPTYADDEGHGRLSHQVAGSAV